MIIDKGFDVENYVGTYEMIEDKTLDATMIVSKESRIPADDGTTLTKKQIFRFNSPNEHLFLKLANLDASNDSEILDYCNQYGLPYSLQALNDRELQLDDEANTEVARRIISYALDDGYPKHDAMDRLEFRRLATHVAHLMNLKSALDKADAELTGSPTNTKRAGAERIDAKKVMSLDTTKTLIQYLVFFSLFSQEFIYDFNNEDPQPQTHTVRFQYDFHFFRRKNHFYENGKDRCSIEYQLFLYLIQCGNLQLEGSKSGPLNEQVHLQTITHLTSVTTSSLISFYRILLENDLFPENGWISKIQEITTGQREGKVTDQSKYIPDDIQEVVKPHALLDLCRMVFRDIVNEGIVNVKPRLVLDNVTRKDKRNLNQTTFRGHWRLRHQMEGVYMELFIELAQNSLYRRCQNLTCGKLFPASRNRPNKIYCCHECAALQAKRNERARKKANAQEKQTK